MKIFSSEKICFAMHMKFSTFDDLRLLFFLLNFYFSSVNRILICVYHCQYFNRITLWYGSKHDGPTREREAETDSFPV